MKKIYIITDKILWNKICDKRKEIKNSGILINDPTYYFDMKNSDFDIFNNPDSKMYKTAINSLILIDKAIDMQRRSINTSYGKKHIDNINKGTKAIITLDYIIKTYKNSDIYFNVNHLGWNSLRMIFRLIALSDKSEDILLYTGERLWCTEPDFEENRLKPLSDYIIVRNLVESQTFDSMKYMVDRTVKEIVLRSPFECLINNSIPDILCKELFKEQGVVKQLKDRTVLCGNDSEYRENFIKNFNGLIVYNSDQLKSALERDKDILTTYELSDEDAQLIETNNLVKVIYDRYLPNIYFNIGQLAKINENEKISYIFENDWAAFTESQKLMFTQRPKWSYNFENLSQFQSDVFENWKLLSEQERITRYQFSKRTIADTNSRLTNLFG